MMAQGGWSWAPAVLAALGAAMPQPGPPDSMAAAIWTRLDENPMSPPNAEPGPLPSPLVRLKPGWPACSAARLKSGRGRNPMPQVWCRLLPPRAVMVKPHLFWPAGTGTGKTLGYLAPSTVWAETNKAPVWVSTYTRSLQHRWSEKWAGFIPTAMNATAKW